MADADDSKSEARARREAAYAQAAASSRSNRTIQILAGTVFSALIVVVLVVVISGGKKPPGYEPPTTGQTLPQGLNESQLLLTGIPQNGFTLGDPKAPMNLVEFLDVQCPFCRDHQLDEQPTIIKQLVRTGKATLTMQPIDLLGGDSQPGRVVLARMATLDRAWDFLNLWYLQQGQEGSGYVTKSYLTTLVNGALRRAAIPADISTTPGPVDGALLAAVDANRKALKVDSTPTFAIGRTGQPISSYKIYDASQTSERVSTQLIDAVDKAAKAAGVS